MTTFAIGRELVATVIWISRAIIVTRMTSEASVWSIVVVSIVTNYTIIGNTDMRTSYHIKIIMVWHRSWLPSRSSSMAAHTVCG